MAEVLGKLELTLLSQLRVRTKGVMTKAFQSMMDRCLREKDNSSSSGQSNDSPRESDSKTDTQLYRQFSVADILVATWNFHKSFLVHNSDKVYKGFVNTDDKALVVAIKKFRTLEAFGDVIDPKKLLLHPNILSPIGFCTERDGLILVHDYMANGSMQDHLYHTDTPLSWKRRLEICIGAAQGLEYLHANGEHELIHRCIEPSSILLDRYWVAKVMHPNIRTTTNINEGILGSVAIPYDSVDQEDDLYSFGVMLLEVLTCNKQLGIYRNPKYREVPLLCSLKDFLQSKNIAQVMDRHLIGKIGTESLREFVKITLSCLFQQSIQRPSLDYIVRRLQHAADLQKKWLSSAGDRIQMIEFE
ncbi:hypothetical protein Vadar_000827 [Vaccinium darrowii]|uniref:Uncharacterized protein n=1 Tax=Vaccinium darrowii TaxID=229202 RepID=A0ACB7YT37_9ERIC|nr:hypothetical protein Vadar_000827 [Vaccinium darrowii]